MGSTCMYVLIVSSLILELSAYFLLSPAKKTPLSNQQGCVPTAPSTEIYTHVHVHTHTDIHITLQDLSVHGPINCTYVVQYKTEGWTLPYRVHVADLVLAYTTSVAVDQLLKIC